MLTSFPSLLLGIVHVQDFQQNYATHSRKRGKDEQIEGRVAVGGREGDRKVISFESAEKEVEENL